jgi:hypothetical protein
MFVGAQDANAAGILQQSSLGGEMIRINRFQSGITMAKMK